MGDENLKNILNILIEATKENDFGEDNKKIQNLYNSLSILQNKLPTNDEIDKLEEELNYLEIKYDIFNELSYYTPPLFITIKRKIHAEEVKKIREENRKKRELNNMGLFDDDKENIIYDFERLIKYLKLAIQNINEKKEDIIDELKRWKSETTIDELNESLPIILKKVTNWYEMYKKTGNILEISLKEYDWVSKETSYILGECALVDDLYAEIIHFVIGNIGSEMCDAIRNGGKTNE